MIPLGRAAMCLDCEALYPLIDKACPYCASRAAVTLGQLLSRKTLVTQCAWCHPPGSEGHIMEASHGICDWHADEIRRKHNLRRGESADSGVGITPERTITADTPSPL